MTNQDVRIQSIALDAGEIALKHFRSLSALEVESKGPLDLVTVADREVEQFICKRLAEDFPNDGIFGEEGSSVQGTSGRTWVIDPIDGTFNFVRGSDDWGISIGLFESGAPTFGVVNAPAREELFSGGKAVAASLNGAVLPKKRPFDGRQAAVGVGIHPDVPKSEGVRLLGSIINDLQVTFRVTGSSVVSLIDVAKDYVDGYIGLGIPSWDILGMLPCLQRLDVSTTIDWEHSGLEKRLNFVCGKPGFLEMARGLF